MPENNRETRYDSTTSKLQEKAHLDLAKMEGGNIPPPPDRTPTEKRNGDNNSNNK